MTLIKTCLSTNLNLFVHSISETFEEIRVSKSEVDNGSFLLAGLEGVP